MGTCQQNFMLAPYHPWHAGLLLCLFRCAKCRVVSHWIRFVARSSTFLAGNGPVPFQEGRRQKPGICTWKSIYKVYGSILLDEHRCFAAIKAQSSRWKDRWKSTSNEWDSSVANKHKVDRHRSTVYSFWVFNEICCSLQCGSWSKTSHSQTNQTAFTFLRPDFLHMVMPIHLTV